MTNDEMRAELEKAREAMGHGTDDARWRPGETAVDALIRERDEARARLSLPVLRTCEHCAYLYRAGQSCEHPDTLTANPGRAMQVDRYPASPPVWCPLRGSR